MASKFSFLMKRRKSIDTFLGGEWTQQKQKTTFLLSLRGWGCWRRVWRRWMMLGKMEFQIEWKMISIQDPPSHFSQLIDDRVGQICQSRRYAQSALGCFVRVGQRGDKPGFNHIGSGLWVNQGQIVEIPFFFRQKHSFAGTSL